MADMLSKDHHVSIICPWSAKPIVVSLSFTPPMMTSWKLLTVKFRKFVQVSLTGQCQGDIAIQKPKLTTKQESRIVDKNNEIEVSCENISEKLYRFRRFAQQRELLRVPIWVH